MAQWGQVIPNELIVPGVSAAIPLQVIPVSQSAGQGDASAPDYKIGIAVVLANPQTGWVTDPTKRGQVQFFAKN